MALAASAVAMRVFDGTTSVMTAEPPTPDALDEGHLGAELGAGEGRLVSAGAAAE